VLCCWSGGKKGNRPVEKLSGEVLAWWREVQMICIYGPADVTATPPFIAPVKSEWFTFLVPA